MNYLFISASGILTVILILQHLQIKNLNTQIGQMQAQESALTEQNTKLIQEKNLVDKILTDMEKEREHIITEERKDQSRLNTALRDDEKSRNWADTPLPDAILRLCTEDGNP